MTQQPVDLQAQINELSLVAPVLRADKLNAHIEQLDYMKRFYEWKAPDAPEKQRLKFLNFVRTLTYAIENLRQYRTVAVRLEALAQKEQNDGSTTSETN